MKIYKFLIVLTLFLVTAIQTKAQTYPTFGPEKDVTIIGLTFDAMEPYISYDGNYLFFNNLNDGINTRLYYATKIDDSTFTFIGELNGTNQATPPHLDAVADMDSTGYFLWTSTRDYPAIFDNLHHGSFSSGNVTNIGRVHGDFNIYAPGWLIMDHGISADGQYLYVNNAYFDTCQGPCATYMQIAQKVNDSVFNVIPNSTGILQNNNDSANYIYYASCITADDLELYYTRFPRGPVTLSTPIETCVAVRNTPTDTFSAPSIIMSSNPTDIIEAPTLTADKSVMYYHRKESGTHVIKMRYRTSWLQSEDPGQLLTIRAFPNPSNNFLRVVVDSNQPTADLVLKLQDITGKTVYTYLFQGSDQVEIDISGIPGGQYLLLIESNNDIIQSKSIIIASK
ncbi:MAG: T9SS type A sorting domain-containing protein [Crocinitomicaceae bacterium]|nr:T9SS type A sorting domain-containing protein [Crocinitomicaceae bacterium]